MKQRHKEFWQAVITSRKDIENTLDINEKYFNGYKTTQDQKYFIWDFFRKIHHASEKVIKVKKMYGSNQIIINFKGACVYNSDTQKKLSPKKFKQWFINLYDKLVSEAKIILEGNTDEKEILHS